MKLPNSPLSRLVKLDSERWSAVRGHVVKFQVFDEYLFFSYLALI